MVNNISYIFRILIEIITVLFRRISGKKKVPAWNLQTEFMWATTRLTLLSSERYGLEWLKAFSGKYSPKPRLNKQIHIDEIETEAGKFLKIKPHEIDNLHERVIIYFHGGGYVTGSPKANIEFTSRLALTSQSIVIAPFYPTAPESTYPAAHQFAHQIVETLLVEYANKEIYLAGDSAGGALVLSTLNKLGDQADIRGCMLISPWTEPTSTGGSVEVNSQHDVGDTNFLLACYYMYVKDAKPSDEYPLTFDSSNLFHLPRTLLTIGTAEMLLDQVNRLHENLKNTQTDVTLLSYDNMFHTFWNMAPSLKEANQIIEDISDWVNKAPAHAHKS